MALVKKGFKVYGKQDIQTKYFAFTDTDKLPPEDPATGSLLVFGKINPQKKCIPAGALVKFDTSSKKLVPVTGSETVNNTSVFLLAEDVYASKYGSNGKVSELGDPGFVYWVVEDVNNLEAR